MDEQHKKERRKGIGGSEAASVLGIGYVSPLAVYLDKIGEGVPVEENEAMYWGTALEKRIAQEYSIRTGLKVRWNIEQELSIHPDHEWMICTLDAEVDCPRRGPGVLECKNVGAWMKGEWEDRVPDHYLVQLMHNIAVKGYKWGALAVLIGGQTFRYFDFDRDDDLIKVIMDKEAAFWFNNVMQRVPPDPTGASLDVLSRLYQKDNGTAITLTGDAIGKAIRQYIDTKAALENLTKKHNDAKALIQSAMGEAAQGIYQDGNTTYGISWSTVKGRVGFDAKAFEKDNPEMYQKYVKIGASYRRFAVKEKKAAIGHTKMKEVANG